MRKWAKHAMAKFQSFMIASFQSQATASSGDAEASRLARLMAAASEARSANVLDLRRSSCRVENASL